MIKKENENGEPKRKRGRPRKNPESNTVSKTGNKPGRKPGAKTKSSTSRTKLTNSSGAYEFEDEPAAVSGAEFFPDHMTETAADFVQDQTQIRLSNGVIVRKEQVLAICESYISGLDNPELIYTRTATFRGMLKQIYISLFQPPYGYSPFYNKIRVCSLLNYDDIESLDIVFSWYTELAYKYNNNISLLAYCLMTGISRDVIENWRIETSRANSAHSRTVKKWLKEAELSAFDNASSGNPGGMFILKACFGYTEQPQQLIISNGNNALPQETLDQIAQRRAKERLQPPQKPSFDE